MHNSQPSQDHFTSALEGRLPLRDVQNNFPNVSQSFWATMSPRNQAAQGAAAPADQSSGSFPATRSGVSSSGAGRELPAWLTRGSSVGERLEEGR
jgi:hypothetical protein